MSTGDLNFRNTKCIQKNYTYLKEHIDALDIVDILFEKEVLTPDDKERICHGKTRLARNEELLTTLLQSGSDIKFFFKSLEKKYHYVLEKLNRQDNAHFQNSISLDDNSEEPNEHRYIKAPSTQKIIKNLTSSSEVEPERLSVKEIVEMSPNSTTKDKMSIDRRRSMSQMSPKQEEYSMFHTPPKVIRLSTLVTPSIQPSSSERVSVLSASTDVKTARVLPASSDREAVKMLPASSEVKADSVLPATSSRPNKAIASVLPTRMNNLNNNPFQRTQNTDQDKLNITQSMFQKSGQDIDLLMIGKTGNGKSTLGNFLLQQVAFESKASTTSVTKKVTYEVTEFNGRKIKVVDSPGVGDTDWTDDATEKFVSEAMAEAISINPRGYHAFLLVVRFGGRFTKEDKGTIDYLKRMFGQNFVKRYCILVMTCGDLFQQDVQDVSFNEWIDGEKGVVAELVKECDHRILLFDNKTKDKAKIQKQFNDLIQMVDALTHANSRYTNQKFELAQSEREKFIVNSKKPIITEETMAEANIILQRFKRFQEKILNDFDTTLLEELLHRANRLNDSLAQTDDKSCVSKDMIDHVQSIQNSINDGIKSCRHILEYRESLRQEHEEKLNEEVKLQSDILHHMISENRKMCESKASMFLAEIDNLNKKLREQTKQLEEKYVSLKANNKHLFKAINEKVVETFKPKK